MTELATWFGYTVIIAIYSAIGVGIAVYAEPQIRKEAFKARRDSGRVMPMFRVALGTMIALLWPLFVFLGIVGAAYSRWQEI